MKFKKYDLLIRKNTAWNKMLIDIVCDVNDKNCDVLYLLMRCESRFGEMAEYSGKYLEKDIIKVVSVVKNGK